MTFRLRTLAVTQRHYKFIQETIFDNIWPFNYFQSPYNILLLSFVYFILGYGLYLMFSLSDSFLIAGTLAAIGISIWTIGTYRQVDKLRDTEIIGMTSVKQKLLREFLEDVFHSRSLFVGVMAFLVVVTYFWTSNDSPHMENIFENLQKQTGEPVHPFIIIYAFIIMFDICYRFGLSGYISAVLVKRNFRIAEFIRHKKLKKQITPRDLLELEHIDRFHLLSFSSGLFFIPLSLFDPLLFGGLIFYLIFSSLATIASILHLRILQARAIPNEVLTILSSSQSAYIGLSNERKTPHLTPTLFVFDGRRVFIATSIKSQKVKNVHKNKNVAICMHYESPDGPENNRAVLIRGRARVYGHEFFSAIFYVLVFGLKMLYIKILYQRKYPEYLQFYHYNASSLPGPWLLRPILSRTLIEIIPYQYIYWEGSKFSRTFDMKV